MKRIVFVLFLIISAAAAAQTAPVRFAYLSDIHISEGANGRIENLKRCIAGIKKLFGGKKAAAGKEAE